MIFSLTTQQWSIRQEQSVVADRGIAFNSVQQNSAQYRGCSTWSLLSEVRLLPAHHRWALIGRRLSYVPLQRARSNATNCANSTRQDQDYFGISLPESSSLLEIGNDSHRTCIRGMLYLLAPTLTFPLSLSISIQLSSLFLSHFLSLCLWYRICVFGRGWVVGELVSEWVSEWVAEELQDWVRDRRSECVS